MRVHRIKLPITKEVLQTLQCGDKLLLSGEIYTARDQAHKRFIEMLESGDSLGFELSQTAIFYCGPSPRAEGDICGAIGPTTSYRMDALTKPLLNAGLKVMIGKGERRADVTQEIRAHGALYLTAVGGVSAVLTRCIVSCETFLWPELGAEAVYRMIVSDLPCYVAIV